MSLLDRLQGGSPTEDRIAVHDFMAALWRFRRGHTTKNAIYSFFNMSAEDITEMDWLEGKYQAATDKDTFLVELEKIFFALSAKYPSCDSKSEAQSQVSAIAV